MSSVKKSCICGLCVALCCVLPQAFHAAGLGTALSPMHLPVLLCGLLCGWPYGAVCGLAGPILSSALTGMPGAPMLVSMVPELCAYGLFAGLLMRFIRTGSLTADLYLSLVPAMVLGRIVGGLAQAMFFLSQAKTYTLGLWATSYLVKIAPGAALHLIILPILVVALTRAKAIPPRYVGVGSGA